jgi:ABC-type Fe3+/spermidine/putrescine transport system ATPase subunit
MSSQALLHVRNVWKRFGERITAAGIDIEIKDGEFFTMLGPSGSGKSTVLRMIAGLEQPDSGQILLSGRDVTPDPPWRRELGMVFQQYANFPHMTVEQNVAYGLRRSGMTRKTMSDRVADLLALVNLPGFETKPVTRLSGGEQQRVAIARSLAPRPRLLLLDEPLSALDEKIRREMQVQLKDIQRATGTTFIYVTHDQEEALTMSDRVAVLNWGKLVQVDEPHAIFRRPRTKFVAGFFRGSNIIEGRITVSNGILQFECAAFRVPLPMPLSAAATPPAVAIRGEELWLGEPPEPTDFLFSAVLERITYRGAYTDYQLRLEDGQAVTATRTTPLSAKIGDSIPVSVRREAIIPLSPEPETPPSPSFAG